MGLKGTFNKAGKSIAKGAKGAEKAVRKETVRTANAGRAAGGRVVVSAKGAEKAFRKETGRGATAARDAAGRVAVEADVAARRVGGAAVAIEEQVRHLVQQGTRLSPEAVIDGILGALGIQPDKKLRLQICILRDEQGKPVATEEDVRPLLAETQRILGLQVHTRMVSAGGPMIQTLREPAPREALDVHVDGRAWEEDLGGAGSYFRKHAARSTLGETVGYAAPVTAFVVRSIKSKLGCALGGLLNYLTLDPEALEGANLASLAHELGHSCLLPHAQSRKNLMYPSVGGTQLIRAQRVLFRSSPHVTYV